MSIFRAPVIVNMVRDIAAELMAMGFPTALELLENGDVILIVRVDNVPVRLMLRCFIDAVAVAAVAVPGTSAAAPAGQGANGLSQIPAGQRDQALIDDGIKEDTDTVIEVIDHISIWPRETSMTRRTSTI